MTVRRWIAALLVVGVLCLSLGGCGNKELHQRILIHGIGVDRTSDGYRVTVRSATGTEEGGEELFTCQGTTVLEALSSLSLSTGREPFYSHNYLVVFGRSCGEEGLDQSLDFFIRYYNTRPGVKLYLAEESAEEILSLKSDGSWLPMWELQELGQSGAYNGQVVSADILEFVNGSQRPGSSPVLPVLRAGEDKAEVVGSAYFREYRLQGFLTLEQTRGYLALQGDLKGGEMVVSQSQLGTVTLTISGSSRKLQMEWDENESPVFRTILQVEADISSLAGEEIQGETFYQQVEEVAAQQLQQEMEETWKQALLQDRCDIFGYGNLLSQKEPALWAEWEEDWEEKMGTCRYEFQVTVKVPRLERGTLISERS